VVFVQQKDNNRWLWLAMCKQPLAAVACRGEAICKLLWQALLAKALLVDTRASDENCDGRDEMHRAIVHCPSALVETMHFSARLSYYRDKKQTGQSVT
jgi:IS1 family transposase